MVLDNILLYDILLHYIILYDIVSYYVMYNDICIYTINIPYVYMYAHHPNWIPIIPIGFPEAAKVDKAVADTVNEKKAQVKAAAAAPVLAVVKVNDEENIPKSKRSS